MPDLVTRMHELVKQMDEITAAKKDIKPFSMSPEEIEEVKKTLYGNPSPNFEVLAKSISRRAHNFVREVVQLKTDRVILLEGFPPEIEIFYEHDSRKVEVPFFPLIYLSQLQSRIKKGKVNKKAFLRYLSIVNSIASYLPEFSAYPSQLIKAFALEKIGEPFPEESINLEDLINKVMLIVEGRALALQGISSVEIEFDTDIEYYGNLRANKAYLTSIIYNNLKNSEKKLLEYPDSPTEGKFKIKAGLHLVGYENEEYLLLYFADTGKPISLDMVKEQISLRMMKNLSLEFFDEETRERFSRWRENPFAINNITWRDLTQAVFFAHLSGNPKTQTSGWGLWGTRYCIEQLNGKILLGETLPRYPIFAYLLPLNETYRKAEKIIKKAMAGELSLLKNPI